jgi:hypothetical protein
MSRLRALWCRFTHPAPRWPVGATYTCPRCLLRRAVPWHVSTTSPVDGGRWAPTIGARQEDVTCAGCSVALAGAEQHPLEVA